MATLVTQHLAVKHLDSKLDKGTHVFPLEAGLLVRCHHAVTGGFAGVHEKTSVPFLRLLHSHKDCCDLGKHTLLGVIRGGFRDLPLMPG